MRNPNGPTTAPDFNGFKTIPDFSDRPPLPLCIDEIHPKLFAGIADSGEFSRHDMIDFVGLEPLIPDEQIAADYKREADRPGFSFATFVEPRFCWPRRRDGDGIRYESGTDRDEHAHAVLMSHVGTALDGPTTIGAPNPVVESGGRYSDERDWRAKWYYWDTWPSALALSALGEKQLARGLTDNIRDQAIRFLRQPRNGNAPEYKRGQPNVYCRLVRKDVQREGPSAYERHLPAMLIEYWDLMEGANDIAKLSLTPGKRYKSVARMPNGAVLNVFSAEGFTYDDGSPRPRPESRPADIKTKLERRERLGRELTVAEEVDLDEQQHTGAGAGIDFADVMLENGVDLDTNRITRRVMPFQNALIFELECEIAAALRAMGDEQEAEKYERNAWLRAQAINKYCYDPITGYYLTYDLDTGPVRDPTVQDGTFMLESGMIPEGRVRGVLKFLRTNFLEMGGLRTSLRNHSKQSWSSINVWPILQISGSIGSWLNNDEGLADSIDDAFVASNHASTNNTGYGKERYHALYLGLAGIGGEYAVPRHNFSWDTSAEVILRRKNYRVTAEKRAFVRRQQIARGVGRLAIP